MAQRLNRYKADLREIQFLLFEQFRLQDLLGRPPYGDWGQDEVKMVLDEVYRYATEVSGPLNQAGDEEGCKLVDGQVRVPEGFKEAWDKLYEAGWGQLAAEPEYGGQSAPHTLQSLADELISGSNTGFQMYPGLTAGAVDLIATFGTDAQKGVFCANMTQGRWAGTMCLTEPHAGSDVGDCKTSATPLGDGRYRIKGTKIFISGGDHDLAENIVHMVLARIEGAPKGTKGLSLFIVPKYRVGPDGTVGESNDVVTASIEHKMGIISSATCVLNFGESDGCEGLLVGTEEHHGIRQMFQLMNRARILVGVQGVAAASSAFLNALEYARERKQGSALQAGRDPDAPRVPIVQHADVRRMLLDMKSRVEGIRALGVYLNMSVDRARAASDDPEAATYHQGRVDLLVPLFKAYATDQAFQIAATAIQTYGGAGFLRDHPVEQYCRDSKIFSIYEGTNHIQAMDLLGRKLRMGGGALLQRFGEDVLAFVEAQRTRPPLADLVEPLAQAVEAVRQAVTQLTGAAAKGDVALGALNANRLLEMTAETAVGWLLLEGAAVAQDQLGGLSDSHPDRAFYAGKLQAARYFAHNVLALVPAKAQLIAAADRSALEIGEDAFATL